MLSNDHISLITDKHSNSINSIYHVKPEIIDYSISEAYYTSILRDLSVVELIQFEKVFTSHQLDEGYPFEVSDSFAALSALYKAS